MDISILALNFLSGLFGDNQVIRIIISVIFLIIGFFLLIKGADIFVDGASKIAEKLRVPLIVIGLTIVAFGTSAPEAAISINSALQGTAGIAIGNIVGSNIMNILLILGISAFFAKMRVQKATFRYEIPFVILITAVLLALGMLGNDINIYDGIIFLVLFVLFFVYLIILSKKSRTSAEEVPTLTEKDTVFKMVAFVVLGLVFIVLGSDITVCGAKEIATAIGIDDRIIGLTVVAFGTSLPELVTSVTAARKGKADIAIGNIIGSNIFNILFVGGLAAIFSPTPLAFSNGFAIDTIFAVLSAVILFVALCINKEKALTKTAGIVMLLCYGVYLAYIIAAPALNLTF